jgi:hypothetical protein
LRRIEEGSAIAPFEVYLEPSEQREFWEPEPVEVNEAVSVTCQALEAALLGREIPATVPKSLIPQFAEFGKTLEDADEIELQPANGRTPVRVNKAVRDRLASYAERPQSTVMDLRGECLEADVRHGRFQIWVDSQTSVQVPFDTAHEELVTSALKDHHSVRILVRGTAEISPQGKPLRFTNIASLELVVAGEKDFDFGAPTVEEELSAIWIDVPATEWARLPANLTDNLDEYLYGTTE